MKSLLLIMLLGASSVQVYAAHCNVAPDAPTSTNKVCERKWMDANVKINQIQVIGSHNSYHQIINPIVMRHFRALDPTLAQNVDYASHLPLDKQLDLGLKQLEIDVYYDPKGGRYAHPEGEVWIAQALHTPIPPPNPVMLKPGFKVLHMPDVDYRSSCLTYIECLKQIRAWSLAHPGHLPIFIHGNAKGPIPAKDLLHSGSWTQTQALPFDHKAFVELNRAVLSVFNRSELITPDDVIGKYDGLLAAIKAHGWPTLGEKPAAK